MLKIDSPIKQVAAIKGYLKNLKVSGASSFINISNIQLHKYLGSQNPYLNKNYLYLKYHSITANSEKDVFIEMKKDGEVNSTGDSIITKNYSEDGRLKSILHKQTFKMEELSEVKLVKNNIQLL